MKIGEFAQLCHTNISLLHYYQKTGLLLPDYVDPFTGYRYYTSEQIPVFFRIRSLKQAGFELNEIKKMIAAQKSDTEILQLFAQKREALLRSLHDLELAQQMMSGGNFMPTIQFVSKNGKDTAFLPRQHTDDLSLLYRTLDQELSAQNYQRISFFEITDNMVSCEVLKKTTSSFTPHEAIDLPFENDPPVIGKWEAIGEFATKEDFLQNILPLQNDDTLAREIYFLPDGERYWCYGWTKGMLLIDDGVSTTQNPYVLEQYDGEEYLFVTFKSYDYCHGGKPTVLVLKNVDHNRYSAEELSRKDDLNLPFVPDKRLVGSWRAHSFCKTKEAFYPEHRTCNPYWSEVTFFPNGSCTSIYREGEISGDDKQTWTKGYLLRKFNHCACAYEIRTIGGIDYLIIEWKSGDYRWGGFDTDYYVFTRSENCN